MNNNETFKVNFPHNRIVFGAPGTGKSFKLQCEAENFTKQDTVSETTNEVISNEIFSVINKKCCNYYLCAIGHKYSDQLKDYSKDEIAKIYHIDINKAVPIYFGSKAHAVLNNYKKIENEDTAIEEIKDIVAEIKKSKKGERILNFNAIGYKYSEYLEDMDKKDISDTFGLSVGNPSNYWLNCGNQAVIRYSDVEVQKIKLFERVTFHPNYSYAQFVGAYKPVSEENEDGENEIAYKYVPGPFMRVYTNAVIHPEQNFLLLIEEINRANVAAVFGDVFQLLDRFGENGDSDNQHAFESEYPVTASEDLKKYLLSKGITSDELRIPSNMYIWATMNSADQGVLPMDAAFKRRWDFEYLGIDDGEFNADGTQNTVFASYVLPVPSAYDSAAKKVKAYKAVEWNKIRHAINDKLNNISGINEDKLLGPYFMSKSVLEKSTKAVEENSLEEMEKICSAFKSKVLMYLFEDVVKMNPTELFNKNIFDENKPVHYSSICSKYNELGLEIFDEVFAE